MADNTDTQLYYEAFEKDGYWSWKIYCYDDSGNREEVVKRSTYHFENQYQALDACCEFMEQNNIDAELGA